ncbi:hypothetical protein ScPMuIL_018388 [Solemya velum]
MAAVNLNNLLHIVKSLSLFILSLDLFLEGADGSSSQEVDQHLDMGKKLLAAGQLAEALSHYHAAVDGDPSNYMTFREIRFRRATVYLALGKSRSALPDLDKVIELKPDFTHAVIQRANVFLKQGKIDAATEDYKRVLQNDPSNQDAHRNLDIIGPLREQFETAQHFFDNGEFQPAIDILTQIIEISPWDSGLRELRAECYMAQGDLFKAIGDIRTTTKLLSDNTPAYLKLSLLHYDMGEADESLIQIRECLKLDPDHKDCFAHYKKVKKLVKQMNSIQEMINEQRYMDCVEKAKQMRETESQKHFYILRTMSHRCHCLSKAGHVDDALKACNEILNVDPNDVGALADRAEAHIANDQFEEAIKDYEQAQSIDQNNRRIEEGLNKAKKLLKQSQKRDYYKILGVKRTARKKEIMKAYRKLAAKWHPDKYEEKDREKAEKMFIDIAAAKEVLTDPEKREQFDNGEDPLDPEQQSGGQGGPFWHQGFNPFGSGQGFQFKFHFN